jgi:hypothetical protein
VAIFCGVTMGNRVSEEPTAAIYPAN